MDQAAGLRELARGVRGNIIGALGAGNTAKGARLIVVTSGKGGVGKTNLALNLALALREDGHPAMLLDADLGLANAVLLLDMEPRYQLSDVFHGRCRLLDAVCVGPRGLRLISGGVALGDLAVLPLERVNSFLSQLPDLINPGETVFLDTGAGLSPMVRSFLRAAPEVMLVTTPEPTAVADAYATIKVISRENPLAKVHLVVNQARWESEAADTAYVLQAMAHRYLNRGLNHLGWIPKDESVPRSVRDRKPFLLAAPRAPAAWAVRRVARLLNGSPPPQKGWSSFIRRYFGGVRSAEHQEFAKG